MENINNNKVYETLEEGQFLESIEHHEDNNIEEQVHIFIEEITEKTIMEKDDDHKEASDREVESEDEYETDEDTEEEIDLIPGESILDKILSEPRKEKVTKGRIIDKENSELDFLLPKDLEEQLRKIRINDRDRLEVCGTMIHRIEDTQTITFRATKREGIMDLGTAVFDGRREMIGIIGYIFGKADEINYQVICKDTATCDFLCPGDELFCAPEASEAYFKASDAINQTLDENSEEEFSDDEKEFLHRQKTVPKQNRKRSKLPNQNKNAVANRHPFTISPMPRTSSKNNYQPRNQNHNARSSAYSTQQFDQRPFMPQFNPQYNQNANMQQFYQSSMEQFSHPPPPFFNLNNVPPPNFHSSWTPQQQWPPRSNNQ